MKRFPLIRRCARSCSRGTCHCLNILLAAIALCQTTAILITEIGHAVPLPQRALAAITNWYFGDPWEVRWQRAEGTLAGSLRLNEVTVQHRDQEEPLLHIEYIAVDLALDSWFRPGIDAQPQVYLRDLYLMLPAAMSPSGMPLSAFHLRHLYASLPGDGSAHIHSATAQSNTWRCNLQGSLPLRRWLQAMQRSSDSSGKQMADLNRALEAWNRLSVHPADFTIHTTMAGKQFHAAARMTSAQLTVADVQMENLLARYHLHWQLPALAMTGDQLSVHATVRSTYKAPKWLAPYAGDQLWALSLAGRQLANVFSGSAGHIDLTLNTALNTGPQHLSAAASATVTNKGMRLKAHIHNADSSFTAQSSWTASPQKWLATFRQQPLPTASIGLRAGPELIHHAAGFLPDHRILQDTSAAQLRFNGSFQPTRRSVEGILLADALHIGQTDFAFVKGKLRASPEHLHFHSGQITKNRHESAIGSYSQHFADNRFAMRLGGTLMPSSLDGFLEDWWQRLFRPIAVTQPIPADVTVWGHWRADQDSVFSSSYIAGEAASYRDQAVRAVELRIRNNLRWIQLQELRAWLPEGELSGMLAWRRTPGDQWQPMLLALSGRLPWPVGEALLGWDSEQLLQFTGMPRIRADGLVWWEPRQADGSRQLWHPQINFSVRHDNVFSFRGLRIESPRANGSLHGRILHLSPLSGQMAGGSLLVELMLNDVGQGGAEPRPQLLRFNLHNAEYSTTWQQLAVYFDLPPPADGPGIISASGILTWPNDSSEPDGSGMVDVTGARLGDIHLLGLLSRAMAESGLGITSLSLRDAAVPWRVHGGVIQLNDATFRGNILSLQIDGGYDYLNDRLSAAVDPAFFSGFFSQIFAPLSRNISFRLSGSLDEPQWSLRLTPLRWITDQFAPEDAE